MKFSLGVTGTSQGANTVQLTTFCAVLGAYPKPGQFHHGDCIGADDQTATLAWEAGWDLVGHPPSRSRYRAYNAHTEFWLPPKPYLDRDRDIVTYSDALVALPGTFAEILRSGTWATVRYARQRPIKRIIIWPDGTLEME